MIRHPEITSLDGLSDEQLLTLADVARITRRSVEWVRTRVGTGSIRHMRDGRTVLITAGALRDYLGQRTLPRGVPLTTIIKTFGRANRGKGSS